MLGSGEGGGIDDKNRNKDAEKDCWCDTNEQGEEQED